MSQSHPQREGGDGGRRMRLVLLVLLVVAPMIAMIARANHNGMAWDEGFYYPAYVDAWEWTKSLAGSPGNALSREGIDAGWQHVNELPPVTRWVGMLGVATTTPLTSELLGVRLPFIVLFLATLLLLWKIGYALSDRFGFIPALVYALHPHAMGYGGFATSETPFALLTAAVVLVALGWGPGQWGRRALLVALFALALATKVNALILGVALAMWLVGRNVLERSKDARAWRDDMITLGLLVIVAPLAALAIWPWMWHDTAARLAEYWAFITQERHYGVWYLGEKWVRPPGNEQPVPWHYAPVMLLVCSPLLFLAGTLAGGTRAIRNLVAEKRMPSERALLLFLLAAGPIMAVMMPNAGKYDNLRLFFPALVPLAVVAVRALDWLPDHASASRFIPVGAAAVLLVALLPTANTGIRYYNPPARLLAQTEDGFAFEASLWGETLTPNIWREIEAFHPEPEGPIRIRTMALEAHVLEIQQAWGVISPRFEFNGDPPYDYHLAHHRRGFWGNAMFWIWWNREPIMDWGRAPGGEPLFILYDGRPPGM